MKPAQSSSLLIALAFALPAIAHAHPGHDGDHDFVWDFAHLAAHPLATLAGISLLVAAGWGVRSRNKSRAAAQAERNKRE